MPPQDLDAIAKKYGGTVTVDQDEIAKKYGGTVTTAVDATQHKETPPSEAGFFSRAGEYVGDVVRGAQQGFDRFVETSRDPLAAGPPPNAAGAMMEHPLKTAAGVAGVNADRVWQDVAAWNLPAAAGDIIIPAILAALPHVLGESSATIGMKPKTKLPPAGQAAVQFGLAEGVPVDAGTATGNRFLKNVQAGAANTPLGSMVAEGATTRQAAAMTDVGQRLAARTSGEPVTPESAGAGLRTQVTQRVAEFTRAADTAYDQLRQIEARPAHQTTIRGPEQTATSPIMDPSGQPITTTTTPTTTMQAAVDMRPVKAALRPLYDRLLRQMPVAQRQASSGLLALKNIVTGPDAMALSDADASLGAIKSLARSAVPEARSVSQGLAAAAVDQFGRAIDAKAAALGPDAVAALRAGRAATVARYAAIDVLDTLHPEPVRAYGQAVTAKDTGLAHLREVVRLAPDSARQIGRAWIDTALDKATAEGGFQRGAGLWADWERLGPETKQIIFGRELTTDLDKFFLLAKKLAEQPNPSRTALTLLSVTSGGLLFTEPVTGGAVTLGSWALAKALHSPRVVRALTRGFQMPVKNGAAAVAVASELMNAAHAAGVPLGGARTPAFAKDQTPTPVRQIATEIR